MRISLWANANATGRTRPEFNESTAALLEASERFQASKRPALAPAQMAEHRQVTGHELAVEQLNFSLESRGVGADRAGCEMTVQSKAVAGMATA